MFAARRFVLRGASAAAILSCALLPAPSVHADEAGPITWSEVRAELAETICVREHEAPDGSTYRAQSIGNRGACREEVAAGALARALDDVLEDIRPLYATLGIEGVGFEPADDDALEVASEKMRAAYLAVPSFVDPILRRIPEALAAEGLVCTDCPAPEPRKMRRLRWDEFVPYVSRLAWPDPVKTPTDAHGKPTGMPRFRFHICTGLNGLSEIESKDDEIARAAMVAVFSTDAFRQRAGEHFSGLVPEVLDIADDEAKTAFLRRRLPEAMAADESLVEPLCAALRVYELDLGIVVDVCGEAAPAE